MRAVLFLLKPHLKALATLRAKLDNLANEDTL